MEVRQYHKPENCRVPVAGRRKARKAVARSGSADIIQPTALRSSRTQPPRRRVGLLAVDRDVTEPPAMLFDEFFALHEHAGRAAARIVDAPLAWLEPLDQHADHAARRVNCPQFFPSALANCVRKIFLHATQEIRKIFERFSAASSSIVPFVGSFGRRCFRF